MTVNVLDDQEVVAQKIGKYNLLAVPVVEQDGSVVGFVTVDDVIDVLIEEQTEDLLRMAAVEPGAMDKPYFDNPILRVVRKRIGWLLLLFVAGTLTSAVLHRFENELAAVVALAFFIPLLIGTGGNAGAQTVMTVIRSLALGEVGVRHAWRVAVREATTGMLVGFDGGADSVWAGAALAGAACTRAHCFGDDVCDLRVVHDGGIVDPDSRATLRRGSGGALSAADHHARGCDGLDYLLHDREGDPGRLDRMTGSMILTELHPDPVSLLHSLKRERHRLSCLHRHQCSPSANHPRLCDK